MPRISRRDEVVSAALANFVRHGLEGTSVGAVASDVGVSKAAISYHFPAKDDLIAEVAEPLIEELEALVPPPETRPPWPDGVRRLIADYLDVLLRHRDVAEWLDGDRPALASTELGRRLRQNHAAMRRALGVGDGDDRTLVAATVALGALWRPVRNVAPDLVETHRDLVVEAALAPLRAIH